MRFLLTVLLLLAGCGGTEVVREPGVEVSGAPTGRPGRGRAGPRRRGADRGRHPRPRVEQVLGDHPQRRRLRGAPARRARRLQVARRLQRRAHERADRPGRGDQAGRARRLDPRARARARDPARGQGRHPGDLDQLGQRCLPVRSACSSTSGRSRTGRGWRRDDGSPTRACGSALCINQERDNTGIDARCGGLAQGDARGGRALARAAHRRRRPADAEPDRPRGRGRTRVDGVLATNSLGGLAAAKASRGGRSRSARSTSARTC